MTNLSAEAKRQRLLRKFYSSGRRGQWTHPFDEFPEEVRTSLLKMASVQDAELPVLSFFRDPEHWVLLTTEQVVTWKHERILRIPWSKIENATVDASHVSGAMNSSPNGKLMLDRLAILLRGGGSVELELEAGAAFIGFWNTLKTVAALNKGLDHAR